MRAPKKTLQETLRVLLASLSRDRVTLSGGLVLIYVPAAENDGKAQLKLLRERRWPSQDEERVVKRELAEALAHHGRGAGRMIVEPWLKTGDNRWWYHTIEWTEYRQRSLLDRLQQTKGALYDQ